MRLFQDTARPVRLELAEAKTFATGALGVTYPAAGHAEGTSRGRRLRRAPLSRFRAQRS